MKKIISFILITIIAAFSIAGCSKQAAVSVSGRTYAFESLETSGDKELMQSACKDIQIAFGSNDEAHVVMPAEYFDYSEYSFFTQKGDKVEIASSSDKKLNLTVSGDTLLTELTYKDTKALVTLVHKTSPSVYAETFECTGVTFTGKPNENAPKAYASAGLESEEEYKNYMQKATKNGQITFYKNGTSYAYFEDEVMYTLFPEDGFWMQEGEYVFLTNTQKAPVDTGAALFVSGGEMSFKYNYIGFEIEYKFKKSDAEAVGGKTYEYSGIAITGDEESTQVQEALKDFGFSSLEEYRLYVEERHDTIRKIKFDKTESCTLSLSPEMKNAYNEEAFFIQNGKIVFTSNTYGDWKGDTSMKFHIDGEGNILSGGEANGIGIYAVYKEAK